MRKMNEMETLQEQLLEPQLNIGKAVLESMIEMYLMYKIYDEHNNEILTEDPAIMQELVIQLLEDNDKVTVTRER